MREPCPAASLAALRVATRKDECGVRTAKYKRQETKKTIVTIAQQKNGDTMRACNFRRSLDAIPGVKDLGILRDHLMASTGFGASKDELFLLMGKWGS
jgi:hypothetical protein